MRFLKSILLVPVAFTMACAVQAKDIVDLTDQYERKRIFETGEKGRRTVGVKATDEGLYITTYKAYGNRRNSQIYFNGERIHKGRQETIARPFVYDGVLLMPNEHGKGVIEVKDGQVGWAAKARGGWSVTGNVIDGRPWVAFNDDYAAKRFHDRAIFYDGFTGEKLWETGVKGMPRAVLEHDGKTWASHNFGDDVVVTDQGDRVEGDVVALCSFNGELYGGGGARVGRTKVEQDRNGKIYRLKGDAWKEIADTGCTSIPMMAIYEGRMWFVGQNPNKLFYMDEDERIHLVAESGDYDPKNMHSFGSSVSLRDGIIYWAQAAHARGWVYELALKRD